ncbi:hypothetical protein RFI_37791 [Reticulomyxa filosa]|uniref:Uncharacterized protein n=1 Tax=Reticulomyxa filosa TaxID=46433 RepID=X6LG19_RETFI|nr:hypothetical protein RFI_37791 [Reticulomyxa filosa]|eukprot:ETN99679.1 hypothetical protein RFI_37791 [Reticulomyxa filosa]
MTYSSVKELVIPLTFSNVANTFVGLTQDLQIAFQKTQKHKKKKNVKDEGYGKLLYAGYESKNYGETDEIVCRITDELLTIECNGTVYNEKVWQSGLTLDNSTNSLTLYAMLEMDPIYAIDDGDWSNTDPNEYLMNVQVYSYVYNGSSNVITEPVYELTAGEIVHSQLTNTKSTTPGQGQGKYFLYEHQMWMNNTFSCDIEFNIAPDNHAYHVTTYLSQNESYPGSNSNSFHLVFNDTFVQVIQLPNIVSNISFHLGIFPANAAAKNASNVPFSIVVTETCYNSDGKVILFPIILHDGETLTQEGITTGHNKYYVFSAVGSEQQQELVFSLLPLYGIAEMYISSTSNGSDVRLFNQYPLNSESAMWSTRYTDAAPLIQIEDTDPQKCQNSSACWYLITISCLEEDGQVGTGKCGYLLMGADAGDVRTLHTNVPFTDILRVNETHFYQYPLASSTDTVTIVVTPLDWNDNDGKDVDLYVSKYFFDPTVVSSTNVSILAHVTANNRIVVNNLQSQNIKTLFIAARGRNDGTPKFCSELIHLQQ